MPTLPLRPINAIFVHQENRYYVVLMQGDDPESFDLYRVTRMKLDHTSWARKTRYTGSFDDIYLVKNQRISDAQLQQTLPTYDLPTTLHGRSLTFFLNWWQTNGYDWIQTHQPHPSSTANVTNLAMADTTDDELSTSSQTTKSASKPAPQPAPKPTAEQTVKPDSKPISKPVPKPDPANAESAQPKPKTDSTAPQNTPTDKPVDDDFFDNMLAELNDL